MVTTPETEPARARASDPFCDQASDGEILLSPRAYKAVEDAVIVEPAGELTLKGIQAPVAVARVIRLKDAEVPTDVA